MAKKTYSVIVNGIEIKRSTDREYTHAIVWASDCGIIALGRSFSGSAILAQKARNQLHDGPIYREPAELVKLGANPDNYEQDPKHAKYRIVPGKWVIVPVALK